MKNFLKKIKEILISKRFTAFYWSSGAMLVAGFLDLVLQELQVWDGNHIVTVMAGLIFAQITKYLNKKSQENG